MQQEMEALGYCPDCYPQFGVAYPEDTPCATWENGGLAWQYLDAEAVQDWVAGIWQGPWRFCGIPRPYPELPDQEAYVQAPPEWEEWQEQHNANMIQPTATP
ncbi:MAG: hypothetical protein OXF83_07015 [Anaerolineaceae bacterium]|nr:hypothetical protein [Anaerolineaceae bacterium]MCY4010086.1 hypothetical protein [Anaerolineaceae bacterium]MCY4107120.1 hypothetical protein [Chloroflexota bacterium]